EAETRERSRGEHRTEPRGKLAALIDHQRERSRDNERAGDAQEQGLASRIDARRREEEDEEGRAEAERDPGVRERAAGDLERRRRRRGVGDVFDGGQRTVADDEGEAAF